VRKREKVVEAKDCKISFGGRQYAPATQDNSLLCVFIAFLWV